MLGVHPSLPFKRRFRAEEEDDDDEQFRVGYAEDIDERRAELLRRLDSKTSGPPKLVNPWAAPGAAVPRACPLEGALMLEVDLQLDGDGYGPSQGGNGRGWGGPAHREARTTAMPTGNMAAVSDVDRLLQDLERSAAGPGEAGASGGAAQLVVAGGVEARPTGGAPNGGIGAAPARPGPPLPLPLAQSGQPAGHPVAAAPPGSAAASPYAALLGASGAAGASGGGWPGPLAGKRPSPLPRYSAPIRSGNRPVAGGVTTTTRLAGGAGGGGGLAGSLSLPGSSSGSSQKAKKAKFVIRDVRTPSAAADAGNGGGGGGRIVLTQRDGMSAEVVSGSQTAGGGGSGLAALLGSGPPPLPPCSATKHAAAASTPLPGRLQRISAPSPRARAASSAGKPGLQGLAAASATPARLGQHHQHPVLTAAAVEPTSGGTGGSAAPDMAVYPSTGGQQPLQQPHQGQQEAATPLHTTPRAGTAAVSLRALLLPPPRAAYTTTPVTQTDAGAAAAVDDGGAAAAAGPAAAGPSLAHTDAGPGAQVHGPPGSPDATPHPYRPLGQDRGRHMQLSSHRGARGDEAEREEEQEEDPQQQPWGHLRRQSNTLELMGRQSMRQREFLQGLGTPAPGSALGFSRRGGAGGRGGAALAGLQGRLQAVMADLKLAFDQEAEMAASGRSPPPPPATSLLVEVVGRTREAHLTKASCRLHHVYAATDIPDGGGRSGGSQAPPPQPPPLPPPGHSLTVFLDSKRGDWGMEPGDRLLVLPPYKVLHIGAAVRRGDGGYPRQGGPAGGGEMGGTAVGPAADRSWDAVDGGAGVGHAAGVEVGGSQCESGGEVVVLAHVTRRWGGGGVT